MRQKQVGIRQKIIMCTDKAFLIVAYLHLIGENHGFLAQSLGQLTGTTTSHDRGSRSQAVSCNRASAALKQHTETPPPPNCQIASA